MKERDKVLFNQKERKKVKKRISMSETVQNVNKLNRETNHV